MEGFVMSLTKVLCFFFSRIVSAIKKHCEGYESIEIQF